MRPCKSNLFERLRSLNPDVKQAVFHSGKELLEWNQAQQARDSKKLIDQNAMDRVQKIMDRSGISEQLKAATFENYRVTNLGQQTALEFAMSYAANFTNCQPSNFIFYGLSGTGKNHLASAIANALMARMITVLVIPVSALISEINSTYNAQATRTDMDVINDFVKPDLLIIDEIGMQRDTDNERLQLTTIIDKRTTSFKPTGLLTNEDLNAIRKFIGVRAEDRLHEAGCPAVQFTWGSYRRSGNAA